MRIAFLLQPQGPDDLTPRINPVTAEVVARLRDWGVRVDLWVPEAGAVDLFALRPEHDLYVLKSKTALALSLGGALAVAGARLLNTVRSCALARDKIAVTALLAAAGVPVPPSWATGQGARLRPLLAEGPLWVKPQRGSKGLGVRRLRHGAEVDDRLTPADSAGLPLPVFAQREVPSAGRDLKVYVVGDRAWAVEKPWPVRTLEDKVGIPTELPSGIRTATLRCGEVVGLELYGVDFVVAGDGFFAVDVNAFPGFRGPADLPRRLAGYVRERAA